MDKETKKKIKNRVLTLREMFENEIENRLNYYGIYRDKAWKDGRSLRHLSSEELGNKKRVEAFIKRQESAGLSLSQATEEFIKEASYTWINRLIGLKCMETRGLIDEEVITVREEFGDRCERHRNFVVMEHPELANTPDGGLIQCLMDVFREVTEEIKILFDPENEYSLIVPRYRCLKDAIDLINKSVDYDVYKEDELLGWVYQYFQTKEKDRIFEEVYKKKKKISGSDIIPVTSLYTEKYMVRFLVENSLGAIWMEMYPDSELYTNWEYFVKDPNNTTREPRPIKDIKFLDPACGSGHFLLYAFDLFFQMYNEEGVVPEEDIPNYILKYNLHGIDIDLRSVQISALSLWMKAKSKNRDIKIEQMNLVAANAIMLDDDILDEFLEEFGGDELAKELVTTIWHGLQNVRELGSLLKVEEQIDEVIERVKGQTRVGEEWDKEQFSWARWKQRIMDKLRIYYEKAAETFDINKQMFANETIKGLSFIDLISQKYDVVATNPPYCGNRLLSPKLNQNLRIFYPKHNLDFYAAFIDRCFSLANDNGYYSMVTQQSFLFTSSFSEARFKIISESSIKVLTHLGPHAFSDIGGEKVNTAMFAIKKKKMKENSLSIFYRLVDSKNKSEELKYLVKNNEDTKAFIKVQNDFLSVLGVPFAYWTIKTVLSIFRELDSLEEEFVPKHGINTGNNDMFIRYHWEVKSDEIGRGNKWTPYMKGGEHNKYFGNQEYVVWWNKEKMLTFSGARIFNEHYFYREGITYTLLAAKGFNARKLPRDFIFDANGPSIFNEKHSQLDFLLGYLNSKLSSYFLSIINPTLAFQAGDVARLPFKPPNTQTDQTVSSRVRECIAIKKSFLQFVINDREFKQPAILWSWENVKGGNEK